MAKATGAEIDVRFQVNDTLRLNAGLGLTSTEIQSNTNAGALTTGNDFQRAPDVTAVAGAVWTAVENLDLSAFARYSDGYFSDDANLAVNRVDSYFTADFQASYTLNKTRFFVDVTNAFDARYPLTIITEGSAAIVGDPDVSVSVWITDSKERVRLCQII